MSIAISSSLPHPESGRSIEVWELCNRLLVLSALFTNVTDVRAVQAVVIRS